MGVIQRMISGLAVVLALGLGAACLLAALAAHAGRFSARLDLLAHFAPFWLAGALVALACGLLLTTSAARPVVLLVAGLGALAAGALMLPEFIRTIPPPAPVDAPHQLKLIQLNAWSANVNMPATIDWIVRENAELVLVEEVTPPLSAALVSHGYHRTRGTPRVEIFSRTAPLPQPFSLSEREWHAMPSFARARFERDAKAYDVIAVHVAWPSDPVQTQQLTTLRAVAGRYDQARMIVAGDFNLTPWSASLRRLDKASPLVRRDRALFSWPAQPFLGGHLKSPLPFLPIDHIYAGPAWRTVGIARGPRLGSDHYPLVITLALTD